MLKVIPDKKYSQKQTAVSKVSAQCKELNMAAICSLFWQKYLMTSSLFNSVSLLATWGY